MTPRQRWEALFSGQSPDRVPCDYWATAEVTARLMRDLHCAPSGPAEPGAAIVDYHRERQLWERLGIDRCIHIEPRHPRAVEETWHTQSLFSIWGVETVDILYGDGIGVYQEAVGSPLAGASTAADVERFDWPDPGEWDLSGLRTACEEWREYPIQSGCYEPFYLYSRLRGMEQALVDLVENPAIAEAALERIHYIHEELIRRILDEAADLISFVGVAEDLGTQKSLLMSLETFRRFLKPWLARMIDLAHSYGVKAFHHDDGAIRPVLPELIEIGIDILNPVQWRCRGMEREGLARDFGGEVVFHGGVDNQQTLAFGTPEDVRREVADNIEIFKDGKGYVVAPCHNIQPNTPTENVVALYEAVREFGGR